MKVIKNKSESAILADIPDPNRKDNLLAMQKHRSGKQNGIPTLVDSNGLNKPSFNPSKMGTINYDAGSVGSAAIGESLTEASESEITSDIMKNNLNQVRIHANDLFNNLRLNCEWDSSSQLIHITILFKDEAKDSYVMSDELYPYPMDITIPNGLPAFVVTNSDKLVTGPDFKQGTYENAPVFDSSEWAIDNRDDTLLALLKSELGPLDDILDQFNESEITEAVTHDEWSLVDTKEVRDSDGFITEYSWYMNSDQKSKFVFGDTDIYGSDSEADYETDDPEVAQEWFDNYTGVDDMDESVDGEYNPYTDYTGPTIDNSDDKDPDTVGYDPIDDSDNNPYLNRITNDKDDSKVDNMTEALSSRDVEEMFRLAKEIGLNTMGDIQDFKDRESIPGETILDTLRRYRDELGPDFKLNERLIEGSLSLPNDKSFLDTPIDHFKKLAKSDGVNKVISRLTQLGNWNINRNPKITKKARDVVKELQKSRDNK